MPLCLPSCEADAHFVDIRSTWRFTNLLICQIYKRRQKIWCQMWANGKRQNWNEAGRQPLETFHLDNLRSRVKRFRAIYHTCLDSAIVELHWRSALYKGHDWMSESSVLMMQQPKKGQMSQNDGLIKYKCGDIIREQVTGSQQCPTLSSIPGASFVSRV